MIAAGALPNRCLLWTCVLLLCCAVPQDCGAKMSINQDPETGWTIYTLTQGKTTIRIAPDAGCNVFSIQHDGVEFMRQPESLKHLPGVAYGVPVLYPMPNRVRGSQFTFEGRTFRFGDNPNQHFIHGLAHSVGWDVVGMAATDERSELTCRLVFSPGTDRFEKFPVEHAIELKITLGAGTVRWDYTVRNSDQKWKLPYGFGLHPYFRYVNDRSQTFLTVPATHKMESVNVLPTGNLIPVADLEYDTSQPISLDGTSLDDVFLGMDAKKQTVIDFRSAVRKVTLVGSDEFTHLVVWTPNDPYFGIENQTCSTDAHNFYSQGKNDVAHLQICEPGQSQSGWVEYRFE